MNISISPEVASLAQTAFYVISPLVTLLAVLVAYIALVKQSRPHLIIQYQPNPDIQSLINLVVENIGNGLARDIKFSQPIPSQCWGIDEPSGPGGEVLGDGLPGLAAGQSIVFDGGQFGGLESRIGAKLELTVSYSYKNPLGISRNRKEVCILSVAHIRNMPTRTSAGQAIVDALKGPNVTTLQKIQKELAAISKSLGHIAKATEASKDGGSDA